MGATSEAIDSSSQEEAEKKATEASGAAGGMAAVRPCRVEEIGEYVSKEEGRKSVSE